MWYKLDFNVLSLSICPTFLRKTKTVALIKALINPIQELHSKWELLREESLYKLKHNGQTCFFRKALNDALDNELRRIYIQRSKSKSNRYVYRTEDQIFVNIENGYVYRTMDLQDNAVDFSVYVPVEIYKTDKFKLEYLINFYKPAAKRYNIQTI